ncbi:hypothetical protein HID58_012018 [Brassica napus]|uniref:Uncharacterized protein n=1 Tax=Brassica napus TaxID=3708 RepID=A0ABQ8DZX9_BRANA|nr:hypothetical protein HID58_012018 [Brassica napus]
MNRRALCLEPDKNKQCNLAICLMRMGRIPEAKSLIDAVRDSSAEIEFGDEPFTKSYDRAVEMLAEVESKDPEDGLSDKFYAGCSFANETMKENKAPRNANRNHSHVPPSPASVRQTKMRQQRFVGILSLLYIVAFLAKNKSECRQEEWGVLEKSPEAALDVDQTIFVAVLW